MWLTPATWSSRRCTQRCTISPVATKGFVICILRRHLLAPTCFHEQRCGRCLLQCGMVDSQMSDGQRGRRSDAQRPGIYSAIIRSNCPSTQYWCSQSVYEAKPRRQTRHRGPSEVRGLLVRCLVCPPFPRTQLKVVIVILQRENSQDLTRDGISRHTDCQIPYPLDVIIDCPAVVVVAARSP